MVKCWQKTQQDTARTVVSAAISRCSCGRYRSLSSLATAGPACGIGALVGFLLHDGSRGRSGRYCLRDYRGFVIAGRSFVSVYLSAGTIPMHLASDYIHPFRSAGGRRARCRVRVYLPDDVLDAPVVVCSELPNNPGGSITNSAEVIAVGVIRANELPTPLVWIEHWPKESTEGGPETFASWSCSLATVSRRERPTSGRRGHG